MITAETIAVLDAKDALMERAFASGDALAIANDFYTEDAWVVGPDDATWRGRPELIALYESVVGVYTWESKRVQLVETAEGSLSEFLIGTIYPTAEGETLIYKIQLVWRKVADDWKCASQFFAYGRTFEAA